MAYVNIEEILTWIESALSGGIGAKLTAIATEKGDGLDLTAPIGYEITWLEEIANFPTILIIPDTTDSITPGGTWNEDNHNIIIACAVSSFNGKIEDCSKRTYRYQRAIEEVILDNRTLSGNVLSFYKTGVNWGSIHADNNGFMQVSETRCIVKMVTE